MQNIVSFIGLCMPLCLQLPVHQTSKLSCFLTNLPTKPQKKMSVHDFMFRITRFCVGVDQKILPTIGDTGWLRLVSSSKLYVSFAKEPYKRDCILQKISRNIGDTGWLRLVSSLKIYVSFAKEPYKRDCTLQKISQNIGDVGWLRLVSSLKLYVSFAKEPYKRDCILQKISRNIGDVGWLRLVGSLKLKVSFAEYSLFYRALLQKWCVIWRSLLIVATPCS